MKSPGWIPAAALMLALGGGVGCTTNPVTGQAELRLVAESEEIAIGEANYAPARQLQGGDWKLDPELVGYVEQIGARLAAASDRPDLPYEFSVLNSGIPNAWALPGGKIAINRGLIAQLEDEAQLAAVLGHEIVHAAARHGARSLERQRLLQGAILATAIGTSDTKYADLAVGSAALSSQLIHQKYGRDAELEADHYGMITMQRGGYDPEAAVDLQELFVRISEARRMSWIEGLFASHPPSRARVAANRETVRELRDAGLGEGSSFADRFVAATRTLRDAAPAYAAYERGVALLGEGDAAGAKREAEAALDIAPGEPRFHALRGQAELSAGRPEAAIADLDRAIGIDADYFEPYLHRGLAHEQAGNPAMASADFQRSLDLLPTVLAHSKLGRFAEERGEERLAAQHYLAIAGTKTELGREAAIAHARIELRTNPSSYVRVRLTVDETNMLVLDLENRAPVDVHHIGLELLRIGLDGQVVRKVRVDLEDTIPAGGRIAHRTNLGPFYTYDQLASVKVQVVAASPGS